MSSVTSEGSNESFDADMIKLTPEVTFQPDPITDDDFDPDDMHAIPKAYVVEIREREEQLKQLKQEIETLQMQLHDKDKDIVAQKLEIETLEALPRAV
jgi:hypothetical protein